jgi:low temperature requirement protein LtrA
VLAFIETVALWWLYFGAPGESSRNAVAESDDPGRVARDAYTYGHLLIIAGIIATAAGDELLIADPHGPQHGMGLAVILGGTALFLLGADLFQWWATGRASVRRLLVAALLIGLLPWRLISRFWCSRQPSPRC